MKAATQNCRKDPNDPLPLDRNLEGSYRGCGHCQQDSSSLIVQRRHLELIEEASSMIRVESLRNRL